MHWYVIHTKPRQEQRALLNLEQQGYECYLPLLSIEKIRQNSLSLIEEPLFPRYLFIRLDASKSGQSWAPIRSTLGVSRLVTFGSDPAKVDADLINTLRVQNSQLQQTPQRMFNEHDRVQIRNGPFAGLEAIYQMADGESRAMVLIQFLSKPIRLAVAPANLLKVGWKLISSSAALSFVQSLRKPFVYKIPCITSLRMLIVRQQGGSVVWQLRKLNAELGII